MVLIMLFLAHSELRVELPVELLSQSRDHNPLDEKLIAEEEHHEVDDQREADLGEEVTGIREDLPGLLEDALASVLMAVTVGNCEDE